MLSLAILAALVAVFAAEIIFGIGPWTKLLQPTNATLVAFGGIMNHLVLQSGEWYRLLSAPFLHVDAGQITLNAIALFLADSTLEPLIGRAWFGAVYVVGALTGSLLSLAPTPTDHRGRRFRRDHGPVCRHAGRQPAFSGRRRPHRAANAGDLCTDPVIAAARRRAERREGRLAANFGGAIGGAVMGLVLLAVWSRSESLPSLRPLAAAVAVAGVLAPAYPAMAVVRGYPAVAFTQLIPSNKLPKTGAEMRTCVQELAEQYPRDPRPHYFRAADFPDANDFAGAEREARTGLAGEDRWRMLLPAQFGNGLWGLLAIAIDKDRHEKRW